MAISVMNNAAAMLALRENNKNSSALSKTLKKVSSGMRLNSAGDAASDYAISEKMRAMIRALNQDEENVKKGITLIRTAEGGIQNIVDSLRNMKELALNSANDHNSDIDRKMLQKSFSSYVKNIDDIASTTNYNGKFLLNGNYGDAQNVDSISEEVIDDSDELIFHTAVGDLKYEVTGDVRYNTHEGLFPKVPERESLGGVKGFSADFDLNSLYKNKDRIVTIEKPNSKRTWWLNYPDPQGKTEVCYVVYEGIFPRKGEPVKEIPREGDYVWIDGDSIRINHLNRDCFVIKDWGNTLTFASYRNGYPLF